MTPQRPRINVLLRSADSNGVVALTDNAVSAGATGPPLHYHDFDEAFFIVEGELNFLLDGEHFTKRAGELAFAPRGVPHTFANHSGADARTLIVCTPAGFERYFDRIAARDAGLDPPPEAMKPWPEVTKVGPPIDPAAIVAGGGPAAPGDRAPAQSFATKVLLRSEQSAGQVAVVENTVPAGWGGPPLHHHDFDEAFYVLAGELTVRVGETLTTAGPGTLAFAARGVHHTLANLSASEARYGLICTPAGFERYFDRLAAEAAGVDPPPEASKPFPETIVVGPPIGAQS
jgi:quercetin dioxygenase-like cupin family protein